LPKQAMSGTIKMLFFALDLFFNPFAAILILLDNQFTKVPLETKVIFITIF